MAKHKPIKSISISIDLRREFSIHGDLIYSINSDSFTRGDESLKISNYKSFIVKSKFIKTSSKKILPDSIALMQFYPVKENWSRERLGFLEKIKTKIETTIWIPYDVWTHIFDSLTLTKCEQIVIYCNEIFRRKADITGVYIYPEYDETDLY